jgi:hypothetical protein
MPAVIPAMVARYAGIQKNAMALAAKHHDQTGHPTWADQYLMVRYGKKK